MTGTDLNEFRLRCHRLYQAACSGIGKRFNFAEDDTNTLKKLSIINPIKVISGENPSIVSLARSFPNLVPLDSLNSLDREWRQLMSYDFPPETPTGALEF